MDGDDRDFLREWLIRNLEPVYAIIYALLFIS